MGTKAGAKRRKRIRREDGTLAGDEPVRIDPALLAGDPMPPLPETPDDPEGFHRIQRFTAWTARALGQGKIDASINDKLNKTATTARQNLRDYLARNELNEMRCTLEETRTIRDEITGLVREARALGVNVDEVMSRH